MKGSTMLIILIAITAIIAATTAILFLAPLGEGGSTILSPAILSGRPDLREIYQDLDLAAAETACNTANGNWTQEAGEIGCTGMQAEFSCVAPLAIRSRTLCQSVGAEWYCDAQNAYCKYI